MPELFNGCQPNGFIAMTQTKKQFSLNILLTAVCLVVLCLVIGYGEGKKQREVIFPEEWEQVKTNDSLIVIYADKDKIELGFNNAKNR